MHLIIADKLLKDNVIHNKNHFMWGALIPDVTVQKEEAHFYEGRVDDGTRRINYRQFINKYMSQNSPNIDFYRGYLSHLISDHIWLKETYFKWLKFRIDKEKKVGDLYFEDFRNLNCVLIEKNIKNFDVNTLYNINLNHQIEELNIKNENLFLNELSNDFNCESTNLNYIPQVFSLEYINNYISECVWTLIKHLKNSSR